jgi:hypothetical protein
MCICSCADCGRRLYSAFYLNFVSKVERPLLERLARNCITSNSAPLISKVSRPLDGRTDLLKLD